MHGRKVDSGTFYQEIQKSLRITKLSLVFARINKELTNFLSTVNDFGLSYHNSIQHYLMNFISETCRFLEKKSSIPRPTKAGYAVGYTLMFTAYQLVRSNIFIPRTVSRPGGGGKPPQFFSEIMKSLTNFQLFSQILLKSFASIRGRAPPTEST